MENASREIIGPVQLAAAEASFVQLRRGRLPHLYKNRYGNPRRRGTRII